jgi:hypothetical protein
MRCLFALLPESQKDSKKKTRLRPLLEAMTKILRRIQHRTNWDPRGEFSRYLQPGQAPADTLQDLATSENTLSIWQVQDSDSNLDRILAAIASPRENLQKLDYLIVDWQHVEELSLHMEKAAGDTHDKYANENWHFHLTRLSASDVANLANKMFAHGQTVRKKEKDLVLLLKRSIAQGFVDKEKLLPNVLAKVAKQ